MWLFRWLWLCFLWGLRRMLRCCPYCGYPYSHVHYGRARYCDDCGRPRSWKRHDKDVTLAARAMLRSRAPDGLNTDGSFFVQPVCNADISAMKRKLVEGREMNGHYK